MPKSALETVKKYYPQVTKLVEAKKDQTFQVTREDSRKSNPKSPNHCALATACERQFDGAIISLSTAYLIKGNKATRYKVSPRIAREIVSFDRHKDFAAGEYRLNAPPESFKLKPLGDRRLRRDRHKKDYARVKPRHKTARIRSL